MQITPVNVQTVSFKGLWGKIKADRTFDGYSTDSSTTKFYYPFKDETVDEVYKVIKENRVFGYYEPCDAKDAKDAKFAKEAVYIKIMPFLNFTKDEFEDYKENNLPPSVAGRIEKILTSAGLTKYINLT